MRQRCIARILSPASRLLIVRAGRTREQKMLHTVTLAASSFLRSTAYAVYAMLLALAVAITPAQADTYPSKPVRIIVPYGPGGIADVTMRMVAQNLSQQFRPAILYRKPAGRGRRCRHAVGKGRPSRRLHPRHARRRPHHRQGAVQVPALQYRDRFHADFDHGLLWAGDRNQSRLAATRRSTT